MSQLSCSEGALCILVKFSWYTKWILISNGPFLKVQILSMVKSTEPEPFSKVQPILTVLKLPKPYSTMLVFCMISGSVHVVFVKSSVLHNQLHSIIVTLHLRNS